MSITRKNLLASTALVATMLAVPGIAGATELDTGMTITATDATGLIDSDGAGAAIGITIDSNTAAITLGANAVTAIDSGTGGAADPVTVTVTTTGTANGVTFAGDVVGANAGDVITINSTNDDLTFQGNVTSKGGAINMGSGTSTNSVTFDTSNNENLVIDATVSAANAGDTITMNVNNSDSANVNTIGFSQAVGATAAIDVLNVGAATTATFAGAVTADDINIASKNVTTFTGLVTGGIDFNAAGTVVANGGVTGTVDNTSGTAGVGTLTLGAGDDVSGNIGETNSLLAVGASTTGDTSFGGTVAATTISLTDNGAVGFAGDVTGAVTTSGTGTITVAADKKIVGSLDKTGGVGGDVVFTANTVDTVVVSGNVGATSGFTSLTTNAIAGKTQTLGGTVKAATVTLAGAGTTAFSGAVTASTKVDMTAAGTATFADDITAADVDFTADGTITIAADKKVVGNLDANTTNFGTVTFDATTTDTVLVSGTVGATQKLKAVNVAPATGKTATFTGAYAATTTTHSGAGTVAFGSTVAGIVNLSGGGAVTAADAITGSVDNTGTAGTGSLTLTAQKGVSGAIGTTAALASVTSDSTGGTSAFGGIVKATTVNVGGTGNTTFADDVTGVVALTAAGTATVAADKKIVGSATTATTNEGTLTFGTTTANTTLVSGDVGTSAKKLLAVNVQTAAGIEATLGGDINATTITLTGADAAAKTIVGGDINATTLALVTNGAVDIATGKNITAAVTTGTADRGILNFAGTSTMTGLVGVIGGAELDEINSNGGVLTMANNFAATDTNIAAAATLKTNGAITFEGKITNSGTLDIGGTLTATAGGGTSDIGASAGAKLIIRDTLPSGATAVDSSAAALNSTNPVDVSQPASYLSGTRNTVHNGGGTANAAKFSTAATSGLATYTYADSGQIVQSTAVQKTDAVIAAQYNTTAEEAGALVAGVIATTGNATYEGAYNTAILAGGTEAKKAAEQSTTKGTSFASQAMASQARGAAGVVSDRMGAVRTGVQVAGLSGTGVASGEASKLNGAWLKGFGGKFDQDNKDGFAGYDGSTYGLAFGVDREIAQNIRLGLAGSYARSDVDGNGLGNSQTDINAYQVALYSMYDAGKYFVEGQLAYAYNNVDTERTINFGGLDRKAKGDYDANQITATVGVGMPLKAGAFTIVPKMGLFYSHTSADSYTETGAGGLNLTVDPGNHNVLEASLGTSVSMEHKTRDGVFTPELRATVMYEMLDDDAATSSKFSGAATSFNTKGLDPEQFGGAIGLGLGYTEDGSMWDVRVDYDAELRDGYVGHSGMLTGRIHF